VSELADAFGRWLTDVEIGLTWQEQRRYVPMPSTLLPLSLETRRELGMPTYPHEYPAFYRGDLG